MSNTIDEPAFPHLGLYQGADGNLHPTPTQHGGMTLRDYFAGQALIGLTVHTEYQPSFTGEFQEIARRAYMQADAMLAARAKR